MTTHAVDAQVPGTAAMALAKFVACAQQMLDAATPEAQRCEAETQLLAQLPVLRALGVFELFQVRDPALAAMLQDELQALSQAVVTEFRRCRA